MEIKRYIPEITTVGLAETAATAVAVKSAVEGSLTNINELMILYAFATFYVGIPAGIVVSAIKNLYLHHRESQSQPGGKD